MVQAIWLFCSHNASRMRTTMNEFQTTSLHLAAASLLHVPNSTLARITPTPDIDGKRVIVITYPLKQADTLHKVVEDFHARRLLVPLYHFNRTLNLLRDRLKQDEGYHVPR